jgi:hypothetical protein
LSHRRAGVRGRLRTTKHADFIVDSPAPALPGLLEELVSLGFAFDDINMIRRWQTDKLAMFRRGVLYNHVLN